jgi:hypothetical protein
MRALIKHVEVGEDGVRVVYKVQPSPFESGPLGGCSQHCWDGGCGSRGSAPDPEGQSGGPEGPAAKP